MDPTYKRRGEQKQKKKNNKQKNSASDCERLLHCAEFGQGHVQIQICIKDIYILTKRSVRKIIAVLTNVGYLRFTHQSNNLVWCPLLISHHAAEPKQTVRFFTHVWNK